MGLYFLRARFLDVQSGRFWSQDSWEGDSQTPKSLHKYLYAENNPISNLDPSGHGIILDLLAANWGKLVLAAAVITPLYTLARFATRESAATFRDNIYDGIDDYCHIDVGIRPIVFPLGLIGWHTYILTKGSGNSPRMIYQGGPGKYDQDDPTGRDGLLSAWARVYGPALPISADWEPNNHPGRRPFRARYTVVGRNCTSFDAAFGQTVDNFMDARIPYQGATIPYVNATNSNSFVYTALVNGGLHPDYYMSQLEGYLPTVSFVPGWHYIDVNSTSFPGWVP